MAVIFKELGFNIYLLRESKEQDEILIYNFKSKSYNQYSRKRAINFLYFELESRNICIVSLLKGEDQQVDEKDTEKFKAFKIKILNRIFDNELHLIDNIAYKPIDEQTFEENDKTYFNIYRKSQLLKNYKPNNLEFPTIKKLILNIVGNNEEYYTYFNKWLGWQIQHPLSRLPTAIILQGEQGTGKTKFCELVLKKIFDKNFTEISQAEINQDHNDYMMGKQLIVANEVIHNDNKYLVPDKLKNMVTDEFLTINQKFKDLKYMRNYAQFIFVSNNSVPIKVESGDRRYSIFKSLKLVDGWKLIDELEKNLESELQGYINYLYNLEIDFSEVSQPLDNIEKKDLIAANYNSVEDFYHTAQEVGGFLSLNYSYDDANNLYYNHLEYHYIQDKKYLITSNLYNLYKKFCLDAGYKSFGRSNFTRELKKFNIHASVQRIGEETLRVLEIK